MGVIIGTAGHIDHGKSALVKALTGTDPDRLKEEKIRGITIELGYVFFETENGSSISFIDVPGHEKFIKTMVAGVATVDCFLLVVSADEGVMPQTREHLDILSLLGVGRGVVALSKCDLVDEELIELAEEEVREALRGTPAESAPIVRVSAKTGFGVEKIRGALLDMVSKVERKNTGDKFRMPIDRIFTLKGFGTIVAGTGLSGMVELGDSVEILPAGKTFRVRELGVNQHRHAKAGGVGDRIALNLSGITREDVQRGSVAGEPGFLKKLNSVDTLCSILPGGVDLKVRQRVRFHVGTAEVMARAIPVEGKPLFRGETGYVHLQLERPVVAMPGDRFVIRRYSPVVTIGGGIILDTDTRKVRARFREARLKHLGLLTRGDAEKLLVEAMKQAPGNMLELREYSSNSGMDYQALAEAVRKLSEQGRAFYSEEGRYLRVMLASAVESTERKILGSIGTVHRNVPLSCGLKSAFLVRKLPADLPLWCVRFCLTRLKNRGDVEQRGDYLALSSFPEKLSGETLRLAGSIVEEVTRAGLSGAVLPLRGRRPEDIEALIQRNMLFMLSENLVSTEESFDKVRELVTTAFAGRNFRLGELRELLGVSRKIALYWAEQLDRRGVTARNGENRSIL